MKEQKITQTNLFKVFIVVFVAACIIKIFEAGYATGQWLQGVW